MCMASPHHARRPRDHGPFGEVRDAGAVAEGSGEGQTRACFSTTVPSPGRASTTFSWAFGRSLP